MEQKPKRKRNKPQKDTRDKTCPTCKKLTNRIYCVDCKEFTIKGQKLVDYLVKETKQMPCEHMDVIPKGVRFVCLNCTKYVKPAGGWRIL